MRSTKGEQTRAAIAEAALRMFREQGYEATTMRAIANADFHAANRASSGGALAAGLPGLMTSWPWELAAPGGREDRL